MSKLAIISESDQLQAEFKSQSYCNSHDNSKDDERLEESYMPDVSFIMEKLDLNPPEEKIVHSTVTSGHTSLD